MAKKGGKSSGNVSAGIHSNVSRSIKNSMRRDYMQSSERIMNQLKAFRKKKNVMLTIENPNKTEVGRRYIRVPAHTIWKQTSR